MKVKYLYLIQLFVLAVCFISCEEVEGVSKYDNWQGRNEAFLDSIKAIAGDRYVATVEQVKSVTVGELFAIQNWLVSTDKNPQYIYCKKLVANREGTLPIWKQTVSVNYYGTLINGDSFDGNFGGYSALDQKIPNPPVKSPTLFDGVSEYVINPDYLTSGWCILLQYMSVGERWVVYVPWASGYGTSGNGKILGYSMLTFDIILDSIVP